MRTSCALLVALALFSPLAVAQDGGGGAPVMKAGEALTPALVIEMRDSIMSRIERFTRMKFRRQVPCGVEPKAVWDRKLKAGGMTQKMAESALAFYTPALNRITVVPWVIGRYRMKHPPEKTLRSWKADLESTMIHELTHAIHFQNFYNDALGFGAARKVSGLTESELNRATVEFLLLEGFAELVSIRTTEFPERMSRTPDKDVFAPKHYYDRYQPDKEAKLPYRAKLQQYVYNDGQNLLHHLALKAGPRGVRGVLYRPPHRILLFQPSILSTVKLDDAPEPDHVLGHLVLDAKIVETGRGILRACFPGKGRFFEGAYRSSERTPGVLIGYVAEVGDEDDAQGAGRYAFYVGDPDEPGTWVDEQRESLKKLGTVKEKKVTFRYVPDPDGTKVEKIGARLLLIDSSVGRYAYAETAGLVVIAHESKPSSTLADRVVEALAALYIKRPTKDLYTAAQKQAETRLRGG